MGKVEDVVKIGDEILVKVTEIDKQGRVNLSRKAVLKEQREKAEEKQIIKNLTIVISQGNTLAFYLYMLRIQ